LRSWYITSAFSIKEVNVVNNESDIWDYNRSVALSKSLLGFNWSININLAKELYFARKYLDSRGVNLKNVAPNKFNKTWSNYLKDIKVSRVTAHKWLENYDPITKILSTDKLDNIYFIRSEIFVKIGVAKNIGHRLKMLQTGNPIKLEIIFIIENKGLSDERKIHKYFNKFHIRGEWFNIDCMQYLPDLFQYMKYENNLLNNNK
jgi:hypothetical protein